MLVYGLKYFLLAFDKNWFSTVASRDVQSGVLGGGSRASYNALCSESDSKLDKNHLMDISCYHLKENMCKEDEPLISIYRAQLRNAARNYFVNVFFFSVKQ